MGIVISDDGKDDGDWEEGEDMTQEEIDEVLNGYHPTIEELRKSKDKSLSN